MKETNTAPIESGVSPDAYPQGDPYTEREQWLNERYGDNAEKFVQAPTTVNVEGVGEVQGWTNPGPDATTWELLAGVDVLGPDYESYDYFSERIVLDWDDTCKDTGKYWVQAHQEVLRGFGFNEEETSDENILRLFGNIHVGNTLGLDRFTKDGKQYNDEEVWGDIKGRARELLTENPMDPLLVMALKQLSPANKNDPRTPHVAVWSSSPRELLEDAISLNGLEDVFDVIVSVDDVEKHKPDPEGLYKAVYAMDVARGYLQPGEDYSDAKPRRMNGVWMIGDSPNDIKGGKASGASTLWLEHALQAHSALEKRQKIMEDASATLGKQAVQATTRLLQPTSSIRTFNAEKAGLDADVSVELASQESISNLPTDNSIFARFLMNGSTRFDLYRSEKVHDALVVQGFGDKQTRLKGVFANSGEPIFGPHGNHNEDRTPAEIFRRIGEDIDENTWGY